MREDKSNFGLQTILPRQHICAHTNCGSKRFAKCRTNRPRCTYERCLVIGQTRWSQRHLQDSFTSPETNRCLQGSTRPQQVFSGKYTLTFLPLVQNVPTTELTIVIIPHLPTFLHCASACYTSLSFDSYSWLLYGFFDNSRRR